MKRNNEAIISPPERPKGRRTVYWLRIETERVGARKLLRTVDQAALGCSPEVTVGLMTNQELLNRIRRGIYSAVTGTSQED